MNRYTIATLGSHSALDVSRGAKNLGFQTLVVSEKGRDETYAKYYKTQGSIGCVDEVLLLDKYDELLKPEIQEKLKEKNSIFVPNRSFEAYLHFDYDAIENRFAIPMYGNRKLLKIEERGRTPNQYDLLDAAQIRYPKRYSDPEAIDRVVFVKVSEKEREFERAFFIADSYEDYVKQVEEKLAKGVFTKDQIESAVIEEFVVGVQVNFNFFYSPVHDRLELMGTDTRRQTNFEGMTRLPAEYQTDVMKKVGVKYEEAGHIAVTVLESLLEQAFAMGERFVTASKEFVAPGIIGPFALQSIIIPGPPKKDILVVDVSPRMPGSPGIAATPYGYYMHGKHFSAGERVAMEIKDAIEKNVLQKILS